jgi:hypothetical protein
MAIFNTQWYVSYLHLRAVCILAVVALSTSLYGLNAADNPPPLVLSIASSVSTAVCGETVEVDVRVVSGFVNLSVLEFRVNWDSTLLALIDQEAMDIGADSVFVGDTKGESIYSWLEEDFNGEALSSGALLLRIRFVAVNNSGLTKIGINTDPNFFVVLTSGFEDAVLISDDSAEVTTSQLSLSVGQGPTVPFGIDNAVLPYSGTTGTPNVFSIDYSAAAEAEGFVDVVDAPLLPNEIDLEIPPMGAPGFYEAEVVVTDTATECSSPPQAFTINKLTEQVLNLKLNSLGSDTLNCGDTVCFTVRVDTGFTSLAYFGFSINWDTSHLTYIGYEADTINGDSGATLDVFGNDTLGVLGYSWLDDEFLGVELPNDSLLLLLKFRVTNAGGEVDISFSDTPSYREAGNNLFENVSVTGDNEVNLYIESISIDFSPYVLVGLGVTVAPLPFSSLNGNPDVYSIDYSAAAEAEGFMDVADATLTSSPVFFAIPGNAPPGTYQGLIWVSNGKEGCSSTPDTFTVEVSPFEQVELKITGPEDVLCDTIIDIEITSGNGVKDLYTLQYSVNWAPDQLKLISSTLNPLVDTVLTNITDSTLVYSLLSPDEVTLDSGEVLLTLKMEVISRTGTAKVDITDFPTVKEALNASFGYSPVVAFNQVSIDLTPVAITPDTALVVCQGTSTAELAYTDPLNAPVQYSIDFDSVAESNGFEDVVPSTLPQSPIVVDIPVNADFGVYYATLQVKNVEEDCASVAYQISITVNETPEAKDSIISGCSGDTLSVDLQDQITNGALGVLFSWAGTDNPNVLGETTVTSFSSTITDVLVNNSTVPQTVVYVVTPFGGEDCPGEPFEVTVTVNPTPVLIEPANPIRVCSDEPLGENLETTTGLPGTTYDVVAVSIPNALDPAPGNATVPQAGVAEDYLALDVYTNLTDNNRRVEYLIVPVGEGGCVGDTGLVAFRILPEPRMAIAFDTVCSGEPLGFEFEVISGSFPADGYELVSVVLNSGLTADAGNTVPSACLDSLAIADDVFFNLGNTFLNVVYTVRPLRGCPIGNPGKDCAGNNVQILVWVTGQPKPDCPNDIEVKISLGCEKEVTLNHPLLPDACAPITLDIDFEEGDPEPETLPDGQTDIAPGGEETYTFGVGETVVTYTVTDAFSNTGTCAFSVVVEDNEAPTISCPAAITVDTDAGVCTATEPDLGTPTTDDNCGVAEVTNDAPEEFPVGTTTVIFTVIDLSDNTATCVQTVEVEDNEAPTIICPNAITVNTDAGECTATEPNLGTPTTNDNCGVASVTDNAPTTFTVGTTTVVFTVIDLSDNTATCTQTVEVEDNEAPTITCPAAITVNTDPGVCTATAPNLGTPTTTDNCGVSGVSNNAPSVFPVGPRVVVYTVTDASGNTRSCTQNVLVRDNEAPVIACADTLVVSTDPASCFAFGVTLPAPNTTDNCSTVNVTNNAPVQLPLGISNVTFTATDQSGNSATCALVIRVKDNELPTIICPNNVSVNTLQGLCYATTVQLGVAQANDNCPNLVVTNNAPILYPLGSTNLTYTVTDAGGNTATCITIVTVIDNQPPVITCPANATVNANANCQATGVSIGLPQVTENCTVSSISNNAPTAFPEGTTQVMFTVTDNSGNTGTCIKTVTVVDNTPPTIVCPANITTSTTPDLCTAAQVTLGAPTVNDNCPGAGFNVDVPTTYPLGVTTVLYTAFDNNGNTATCTQQVTVNDTQSPVINCPPAINLNTDPGACTSTIPPIGSATATDNCSIATINSNKPAALPLGVTIVRYTATDVNGNTATCTQVVTIIDQEKPVLTACPSNITVNAPTGLCTATVSWNPPVATDNCTNLQTTSTHQPGAVFQVGSTTVVYTATDVGNNSAVCSFVVTVRDQTPPVLSACPGNINVGNTPNACGANVSWTPPTASDNCGTVVLTTNHNPGAFFGIGQTNVVYTATDASGNTAVCTFSIRVNDTQAPTLICPANITVNTPANDCFAPATWTIPTPADNCQGAVISNATHQPGSSFQLGTTTVRYTAVDAAGTSTSCSFTVTVVDNVPPKAVCVPTFTINLNGNGIATLNPVLLNAGSTDNCGISAYTAQPELFTCTQVGVQVVTLVVSDNAGNTASCTTTISVNASPVCTPPVIGNSGGPNIHDPCFCIGNGRFSEEVVIGQAGSGQAWRVSSATLINPSTSLPYPVGTLFMEIPLGGGLSQYVLAGVHIDGVGYTVAAQSPFYPGTTLSIGNTCSYPDLTIVAGDQGPYCQFTAPVTFTGSANGGIAGVGQFLVDNVPVPTSQNPPNSGNWVAVVNVGSLSAGSHTLTFNFDAGNPAGQLPPANIGCTATENLIFDVSPAPSVLVCNQLTTVVLGGTCLETITPDEVLSTAVGCVDDYIVTIVGPNGQIGNTVNGLNIGQALTVTVTNLVNGSSCAGDLDVIDISGPDLVCPDVFVPCILTDTDPLTLLNLSIPNAFPTATDNCSAVNDFDFADQLFDLGCSATINNQTNMSAYILRTWTARDEYGNSGQCQQFVYLQRLPVSQVQFPPNTSVSCAEVADPDITGTPFVTVGGTVFPVYPDAGICELTAVYTDVVLPGTGCNTQTIQRTWAVFGTCQPGSVNPPNFNPRLLTQVIQVTDNTGPEVDCPADITANANSGNCCASVNLPDVVVSDPCSRVKSARALVIRIDPQTGDTLFVFTVAGALTNFPGNDPQDPDTLASYGTTTCLPIGQYRIVYLAEDVCGNIGSCAFNLRVGDMTPPNAVCAAVQSVTLNAQEQASLNATAFNNGSTDNCGAVAFKARRLDAALCQGNNQFFDNVLFCCEDVGDTAFVVLRVYDVPVPVGPVALNFEQVHATDCVARVLVRDTVAPTCVAPNDTVVTCGTYTPDLDKFSDASASDNCCLDTLLETLDLAQFDTICKRGIIQRTFTAVDCDGNSSVCRQNIQFDYIQTYVIQFPDDVVAPACSTSGLFGEPEFFLNNCENLDVSFTDVFVPGTSGLCSRVERTWRIVNLCTYVPALPLTVVPNPQPDDDPIFADNLPGPIVSPLNTPSPWMPTVVALTPGAQPTNFSQYWSSNSNGYAYIQYIYVVDDIDPVAVTACPTDTVRIGDASTNDPGLWNASFWFDPLNTSNDLCEATAALSFSAEDNCGGNLLDLRYELFLDLDGNGTQETVVKSDSLPAVNTVRFNNLASGNVNGGTARAFDQRGLAVNQQYRFALEKTVVGNQATAQVRWNTTAAANVYSAPQLPNGIHRIRWIAEDACGNSSSCEYVFALRDTLPPTLVCQGGTFNLGPGGVYNLLTSSLFSSATDNCTPQNKLNFSMRIVGSGNGFPLNPQGFPITQLAFDCGDLGTQNIELWVADAAFNTRVCTTAVIIDDAVGFCSSTFYDVGGNIKNDKLVNYEGAEMSLSGMHPSGFAFTNTDVTGTDGNYLWSNIAPDGAMYTVKPFADDNPLNGVFTSDLVFIQNHILQKDTLDTPYRVIAADANKSGAVTGLDITEIRKLILGINSKFPKNTSWRFVDKTWVFNNILNPFNPVFPETITIDPATMDELTLDFVALKVGDANGSAQPNNLVSIDDRTAGQMAFEVETDEPIGDRQLLVGETVLVRIRPAEPVAGYQFTLSHAGLELLELLPGVGMTLDHFGVFPDKAALTTSWDGKTGGTFELRLRVLEPGQLSDLLRVSGSITPAQAYRSINERPLGVALSFSETGLVQVPDFELYQNRPNPFNGVTWIGFYLPEATVATLRILDETGRLVYMRHAEFDKGEQYITLTADELGATGVMYYELTTPTNRAVKKMVRVER